MIILQPAFKLLTIGGCWRPSPWTTTGKRILYAFYTVFVFLLLHSFCLSQLLNALWNVQTTDDLSDSFYMFIANILACFKLIVVLLNHENIKILCEKLRTRPCEPRNREEMAIQRDYDRKIGSVTIYYAALVEITVLCMIISSLLTDFRHKKLAYNVWLPFNHSSGQLYYVAYVHQLVSLIATSILNVAGDTIFCGLCVHACSQQAILQHRLKELPTQDRPDIGPIVKFHKYLYRYSLTMQEKFQAMIGIQLLASTLVVCFILYQLTNTPLMSLRYLQFVLYMVCMMTQIFFYCWYGNALKLKSVEMADAIFEIDWINLDNSTKRSLIMIMRRATNPIELTSVYVFTMDLGTFVSVSRTFEPFPIRRCLPVITFRSFQILRMSYSTYNLLQRNEDL
nr:odorant receptor 4-like [Megalopta genalis]